MLKITDVDTTITLRRVVELKPVMNLAITGIIDLYEEERELVLHIEDNIIGGITLISRSGTGGEGFDCSISVKDFKDLTDPALEETIKNIIMCG